MLCLHLKFMVQYTGMLGLHYELYGKTYCMLGLHDEIYSKIYWMLCLHDEVYGKTHWEHSRVSWNLQSPVGLVDGQEILATGNQI